MSGLMHTLREYFKSLSKYFFSLYCMGKYPLGFRSVGRTIWMQFSEIAVKPILSTPFQELGYVVHRKNEKDCFVIDPGLEPENFLELFEKKGLNPVALLVTHGHGDHIGGISAIREQWKFAKIYIGEHDAEKLTDPKKNLSANLGFGLTTPEADVLLRDGDQLELAGISLEVRHVPGHSKGHVVYWIAAEPKGILFVGDVIFQDSIGRNDFPDSEPAIQISMIRSKILTLPEDTIIYPGHGNSTTVRAERRTNRFLQ